MQRGWIIPISILVGLLIYSAVLAQGGQSTYAPLVFNAAVSATPTTPVGTPTVTPTITPRTTVTSSPVITSTPAPIYFVNGDFEQGGDVGWEEYSSNNLALVVNRDKGNPPFPTHSGEWLAWLGGTNYETADLTQTIKVPGSYPSGTTEIVFWYRIESQEDYCASRDDMAELRINGQRVWEVPMCEPRESQAFEMATVPLQDYELQQVTVAFHVSTNVDMVSSFFLEDVNFLALPYSTATPYPTITPNPSHSPTATVPGQQGATYHGYLKEQQSHFVPSVNGFVVDAEGTIRGVLSCSDANDFNLKLARRLSNAIEVIAESNGDDCYEALEVFVLPGRYVWFVSSVSGSGDYLLETLFPN